MTSDSPADDPAEDEWRDLDEYLRQYTEEQGTDEASALTEEDLAEVSTTDGQVVFTGKRLPPNVDEYGDSDEELARWNRDAAEWNSRPGRFVPVDDGRGGEHRKERWVADEDNPEVAGEQPAKKTAVHTGEQPTEEPVLTGEHPAHTGEQRPKKAKVLTGEQTKAKRSNASTSKAKKSPKLTSEQADENAVKAILPKAPTGWWWDVTANGGGFKLMLRWRGGEPPRAYVFPRLGKNEFKSLKGVSNDEQKWLLADRLHRNLIDAGRHDIARRFGFEGSDDR